MVVDGAVRDLDGLDAAGLPAFALGAHPATGSNQGPGASGRYQSCPIGWRFSDWNTSSVRPDAQ
jgi:hypothetical protein